jgi:PAS domain S-box-containing protein
LVVVIAGLTLAEYALHVSLGIDQLFFLDMRTPSSLAYPGRMATVTAICFLCLGLAVTFLGLNKLIAVQHALVASCLALSLLALCGYLYGVQSLYLITSFSTMALHTSAGLIAAALAYFLARPDKGIVGIAASESNAGVLLRGLVPTIVVVSIALGWLRLAGQKVGLYDTTFGVALHVIVSIGCLTAVTFLIAHSLLGLERERERVAAERWRAVDALRQSEKQSRELVLSSPVAMAVTHGPSREVDLINVKFTKLFGYSLEDVPDEAHWWPLAYPNEKYRKTVRTEWQQRVDGALREKSQIEPMEASVRCKDGSNRYVEFHFASLGDTSLVSFVDLTDRKRAETVLQESEERFRRVANTAPVMIWMSGTSKECNYFNQPWLQFTGRNLEEELGNGWLSGVHPDDLEKCFRTYTEAFDRHEAFHMEYRLRRHDGEYRWIFDQGVPRYNADGSFAGYIGSCIDVTERKLAEEALSAISGKLIEAQERERTYVARELHDDVTQRIAVLTTKLDSLKLNLPASAVEARKGIAEARDFAADIGSGVQGLSHRLHSSKLEYLGLEKAAESFCREFSERQKVEVEYQAANIPQQLPQQISLCLFRVLQEALQNAAKYSGSRHFRVSISAESNDIYLTVRDSGIGFDPDDAIKSPGIGLVSMKERLKLVDGELSIKSGPEVGATIRARVPLNPRGLSSASSLAWP